MGKITDAVIALIVLILGIYVLSRMGLNLADLVRIFRQFFFSKGASNSTSSTLIAFGSMTNSEIRRKISKRIEDLRRRLFQKRMRELEEAEHE